MLPAALAESLDYWTDAVPDTEATRAIARLLDGLFDEQREAWSCTAVLRCLLCTRRAGKTALIGRELLERGIKYPNTIHVFMTLTKGHSCDLLETTLDTLNSAFRLGYRKIDEGYHLTYKHPNGSELWLCGCKDKKEAEKYRGHAFKSVYIDEAASYDVELLKLLVEDILDACLSDLRGQLTLSGTPGYRRIGYFFAASTGEGQGDDKIPQWPTFSWSVVDNPHHEYTAEIIEEMRIRKGWPKDHPKLLREWYGKWVNDTESIIYNYDPTVPPHGEIGRNLFYDLSLLPDGVYYYVLSVDLGTRDHTTFTVTASREGFPEVYALCSYGKPDMRTSQRAAEIKRLMQRWDISKVVVDQGGLGLAIADDMRDDYDIPAEAAVKKVKSSAIRNLKDAVESGFFKVYVRECKELLAEWNTLVWNEHHNDHEKECKDDCSDGALYGYREHPIFEIWNKEPPKPGTPEAIQAEMDAHKRELQNRHDQPKRRSMRRN